MTQCTAKSKTTGQQCRGRAIKGRDKCRLHGGRSLLGPAAGSYKDGRYSKLLPQGLATKYNQALTDPEWLALKDEIALNEARLGEALEKLTQNETPALLEKLDAEYGKLRNAIDASNPANLKKAMANLDELFSKRTAIANLWREVDDLIEQRRRLSDTEQKRLVAMQQMLSTEQALVLIHAIIAIIKEHVTDTKTLASISTDLAGIIGQRDATPAAGDANA